MLKVILDEFRQKYHLRLGSKPSSPVMEFSAGLALQYARNLITAPATERKPFYLSVPDKEHFIIRFSCTVLLDYLLEDYYYPDSVSFKRGDKVRIFGSIAQYIGPVGSNTDKPMIRLLLADTKNVKGNFACVPAHYVSFMSRADEQQKLSKSLGDKKAYHSDHDLNILFNLKINEVLNPNALISKLYLVTGRGHAGATRERIRKEICINQNLAEAFRLETNLVVKPDLEGIKSFFNIVEEDNTYFITSLNEDLTQLLEIYDGDRQIVDLIKRLTIHLNHQDFSDLFRQQFDRLADSIDEPYRARLLNLTGNIPIAKVGLPSSLRMVVLDSIDLAADYTNTINGLVGQGVPVIILSDRSELASRKDNTADGLTNGYRFYWSRKRVKTLVETETVEYCDEQFWQRCLCYANQEITIRRYNDSVGDTLFNTFESNSVFARLDGFENLKKAYYQYLRPTLYLLKNTPGRHPNLIQSLREQVNVFSQAFKLVESQLPASLATSLAFGLVEIENYTTNPKLLPDGLPVFIQKVEFPDGTKQQTAQLTPKAMCLSDLKQNKADTLIFTGFPYREWNGKYLFDAVFHSLIRSITILAWPEEAQLTISYLMKRIQAASFGDNLPQWISYGITGWQLPYQQSRPDESDLILRECELPISATSTSEPPQAEAVFEEIQRAISNFRFTTLPGRAGDINEYMVPADVLYFHNGSYMLLPHGRGGHVHVISTQHKVTGEIDQASFQELAIGDTVVCFNMNRDIIRHLSREHLSNAYEHLDIWRNCLQRLLDVKSGQFSQLEESLIKQKAVLGLSVGSPTRQNIIRWQYETDMLAPHNANMWLILRASGLSESEAESALGKIEKAKRLIIRNSSLVFGRIRSRIMTVLRDRQLPEADILLDVDGVSVAVQCGRITDKEKRTDMEVPYASTKRFIKD